MIKVNELRVGNLIDHNGSKVRVYEIDAIDGYLGIGADDDGNIQSDTESAKPIPLTHEILEKCGFKKEGDFSYLQIDENSSLKSNGSGIYLFLDSCRILCEYVHQLQNLYFALTEQELEIKL